MNVGIYPHYLPIISPHFTTSKICKSADPGTILVYGDCDFPHFFNMAAHLNHTTTSCYHAIVGLTNLTPVIQTQTFHQYKSCNSVLRQYGSAQLTTQ